MANTYKKLHDQLKQVDKPEEPSAPECTPMNRPKNQVKSADEELLKSLLNQKSNQPKPRG